MSIRRGWEYSGGGIKPCGGSGVIALGYGEVFSVPESLRQKLLPQNNTGLGSASVQGNLLNTRASTMPVLDVVNNWLTNKLTADELALILRNRSRFTFTIGVGDRREEFKSRFRIATNWHGEDVSNFLLSPDPWNDPHYNFRLTFTGSAGTMKLTDTHASPDTYGSIRYFTVREKVA
ncbi:hypothetical protein CDJ04_07160 [Salmonella enterica]|uniref:Uncharacterized protein n=2 Tax=Salmonella enterica TaxID=28901 RepID=A0A3R1AZ72_SALET|nr:hypothetical protein [Salmonella enterica]EBZ5136776.1 hypothetical protein [Salmonella enterica subsp. enterica serovar Antsalova]ECD6161640.1 hypothetical protein [Salmonella enterica subsp. enterica]ECU7994246.1 hypothetical protein [Salmonella enterica subsp. enterica serovar Toucra]EHI8598970.1 hypothetical protein [Salmonella enterica subsp. enterica serovar 51:z:1,5]MML53446.1 hypothetical protein [Salmonella enterica subsp. enterica serovar Kidderminster]